MVIAAAAAIFFRVNLPISVGLVWVTNPITIPPMFYSAYKLGAWILGEPIVHTKFELTMEWLQSSFSNIWQPLLTGSLILGSVSAVLGYALVRGFWRMQVVQYMKLRRERRKQRKGL